MRVSGNIVRRLRWAFWKALAWIMPKPKDKVGNPRDKKKKGDPDWMLFLVTYLRVMNAAMGAVIIVALLLLAWVNAGG